MPDSNWRPHGPKPCALPTEPIPESNILKRGLISKKLI